MKIFLINLEHDIEKRINIESECKKQNINYEIINAVDGKSLSDGELSLRVLKHELNYLTKGEIGCALSHQKIYNKIIDKNLDFALILEDDALLLDDMQSFISDFLKIAKKDKNEVFLLHKTNAIFENKKININDKYNFYEAYNAKCTHGYIITNKAAKTLKKINTPLIREADHWLSFYQLSYLKVYALDKDLVISKDAGKIQSSIEKERNERTVAQLKSKDEIINKSIGYKLIKSYHKYIRRLFLKKKTMR